ncbi:APC family permease [Naasia sp. SYSU D00057]|uniref:APC family permease n=1 Tax=Naasia sp. SYSU D00057 TaxID=2817380 RepID=UPI0027DC531F|nr:APC family permease [Naasia sp. SYSU D00057]
MRNPSKVYPRALFAALGTAAVVYLLIALGAVIAVEPTTLTTSSGPLLEVVRGSGVGIPLWIFSLIALVAIANGALLFMVMASRVAYGLAESGLLPSAFGRVVKNRRTPWVSILVIGGATMLLSVLGDVGTLAQTTVLLLLLVFISANVSVLVLPRAPGGARARDHRVMKSSVPLVTRSSRQPRGCGGTRR